MQCACGVLVPKKRVLIGLTTCLRCGEREAVKIAAERAQQVVPICPKGPLQWLGPTEETQRAAAKRAGRKAEP